MVKSSGLVGLSPNHYDASSDLFVEKMKKAGAIDHAMFSISLGVGNIQSKITFGGYDLEKFAKEPLTWHNLVKYSHYWEINLEKFTYKGIGDDTQFVNKRIIVDSGTSFILIPFWDMQRFLSSINAITGINFAITNKKIPSGECTDLQFR